MNIVQILGICVVSAAVAVLLKGYNSEYSLLISLISGIAILLMLISGIAEKLYEVRNAVSAFTASSLFIVALKSLGICVITGFIADSCRQAGQLSLASKAELAGRCAIFVLSVPMLLSLLETAYGFIM